MTTVPSILHQADVEAVIDARHVALDVGDTVLGTAAELDTGTASDELPTNGDLGDASLATLGTGSTEVPTNGDLGGASLLEVGQAVGTVAAGDDARFTGVWGPVTAGTSASAANLAAIANAINTAGKDVGTMVWDTTNHIPLFAGGAAAGDHWYTLLGVDTITPA